MQTPNSETPLRVGVFDTVAQAECAVSELLAAGFTQKQITVICSDETKEREFRAFEHQDPAGTTTATKAVTGGTIGAVLGGLAAVVGVVATGGVALIAAGGIAAWGGGVVGGLVGAMLSRGVEKSLANYYDQSVAQGKILVAAEDHEPGASAHLAQAARILEHCGAQAVPLRED